MKKLVCTAGLLLLAASNVFGQATAPATTQAEDSFVVAADGSGNYKTVLDAINAVPQFNPPRPFTIHVKPGTYRELVYIQREKRFVRLVGDGDDATKTIITFDLNAGMKGPDDKIIGTFRTPTFQVDADDFTAENITFENAAGRKGQALAIRIDGDCVAFRKCRFLGYQDTIFGNRGRHYYEDCYIEGAVDFIFGGATEFFERCEIHAKAPGYFTAASTPSFQEFGYVFDHCKLTGAEGVQSFLGRPWRPFAATVYMHCEMSDAVKPQGWNNWGHPDREKTTRYAEFENTGRGAETSQRVKWAKQLTAEEAAGFTVEKVLGNDGWRPDLGRDRK